MQKYKGTWNCLAILTRALGGNYVNFGVFELYGDPALKVTTSTSWLSIAVSCLLFPQDALDRSLKMFALACFNL